MAAIGCHVRDSEEPRTPPPKRKRLPPPAVQGPVSSGSAIQTGISSSLSNHLRFHKVAHSLGGQAVEVVTDKV